MISWNCSGPNRPDERIINRPLSRTKTPSIRFSILYPLRHSLIIIFTLHILLLYLYISHTPFTRAILVVDYYGVLALLAHRVRPFRFWFIIVDDIILIRCKLLCNACSHLFPRYRFWRLFARQRTDFGLQGGIGYWFELLHFLSVYIADQSYCYRSDFFLFSIVCVIISSFETLLAIQVVNTIWRDNLRHFRWFLKS